MTWKVVVLATAEKELEEQPSEIHGKFDQLVSLIETFGLWEFRLIGKDAIARALYVTRHGRRIFIVRVFTKKTQKAPRREIRIALKRARNIQ